MNNYNFDYLNYLKKKNTKMDTKKKQKGGASHNTDVVSLDGTIVKKESKGVDRSYLALMYKDKSSKDIIILGLQPKVDKSKIVGECIFFGGEINDTDNTDRTPLTSTDPMFSHIGFYSANKLMAEQTCGSFCLDISDTDLDANYVNYHINSAITYLYIIDENKCVASNANILFKANYDHYFNSDAKTAYTHSKMFTISSLEYFFVDDIMGIGISSSEDDIAITNIYGEKKSLYGFELKISPATINIIKKLYTINETVTPPPKNLLELDNKAISAIANISDNISKEWVRGAIFTVK